MVLKPNFYDLFKCTADKCEYTCCRDWNIDIDNETYEKYRHMEDAHILESITENKDGHHLFLLDKEKGTCPHLDEMGLCQLVLQYGEQILCKTCDQFPRSTTNVQNGIEQSLSNACPAVLEMLREIPVPLSFVVEDEENIYGLDEEIGIRCRNQMIDIMQLKEMPVWLRLFIIYRFSDQLSKTVGIGEMEKVLIKYQSADYVIKLGEGILGLNCDYQLKMTTLAEIFDSINALFTNQFGYKKYIHQLSDYLKSIKVEVLTENWERFESFLQDEENFLENFCVNYLFSSVSVNGKLKYSTIECLILEYISMKFTLYLQWLYNEEKIYDEQLIGICTYYSRSMNHNQESVREFMKEETGKWFGQGGIFILLK